MPLVDMSLDKLRVYEGRNERPADIDAYWDKAVADMEKMGIGYEMKEAAFQARGAKCYDMYFMGVGGSRIYTKFVRPEKVEGKLPAVLIFHGYSGSGPSFSSMLSYITAGFCVFAMDARGQGGKSDDKGSVAGNTLHGHIIRGLDDPDPENLLFRQIFLDTAQLARIAMAMDCVDENRVAAIGGSQGGALTLACAALTPKLNRAAPQYPFLCDYRRVWEMDLASGAYQELKDYFRRFDPLHEREAEMFTKLGYIDNQHIAHRIRAKVRMFTGLMDTTCPPSTQFAAYNKITAPKEVVIYPDYGHEGLPGADDKTLEFLMEM